MKTSIIILTFLTIVFVISAIMISVARNAPDTSINYKPSTPSETTGMPKFEIVTEKKSIYELMDKSSSETTTAAKKTDNDNDNDTTTSESDKNKSKKNHSLFDDEEEETVTTSESEVTDLKPPAFKSVK